MLAPPRLLFPVLLGCLLLSPTASAGTPGTFRGILGEVADRKPGWMYVRGNHDSAGRLCTAGRGLLR